MAEALAGRRSGRVDVDLDDPRIDAVLEEMKRHGTVLDATLKVEAGKYANLVFLEEDPTAGVENLRSVRFTLKRGHRFDRGEFELGTQPDRRP